jgi:hypothetical protein
MYPKRLGKYTPHRIPKRSLLGQWALCIPHHFVVGLWNPNLVLCSREIELTTLEQQTGLSGHVRVQSISDHRPI